MDNEDISTLTSSSSPPPSSHTLSMTLARMSRFCLFAVGYSLACHFPYTLCNRFSALTFPQFTFALSHVITFINSQMEFIVYFGNTESRCRFTANRGTPAEAFWYSGKKHLINKTKRAFSVTLLWFDGFICRLFLKWRASLHLQEAGNLIEGETACRHVGGINKLKLDSLLGASE